MVARLLLSVVLGLALLALAVLLAGRLGLLAGRAPADLGVRDGRLKAPSMTPNSVSSQAGLYPTHPQCAYALVAPLGPGPDPANSIAAWATVVAALPHARIVEQRADYLHAEVQTPWLRFTDDLELWAPPPAPGDLQAVHVRSASRLGRRDFGVNRARVEALRRQMSPQVGAIAADKCE